jgi:hypothetical protein
VKKPTPNLFKVWGEKIGWKQRVKAVCKPCWEIKYCPYGPLVEQFPLDPRDERSCRIFGHHCPVFYVAEPFTETKELRNISRHIPRPMQFRILKRDNQICSVCQKPVLDADIHFDHIIPWSKGGPTEEYNLRLLCGRCNQKRGVEFETDYLIESFRDHVIEPVDSEFIEMIVGFMVPVQQWRKEHGRSPSAQEFGKIVGVRKVTRAEEIFAHMLLDLEGFFKSKPPEELKQPVFDALRRRWGYENGLVHRLEEVASPSSPLPELLDAEHDLVRRLGWPVKNSPTDNRKWQKT